MSEFQTYFTLGYQHILDWNGYDHMVFLLALLAPIAIKDWKKIIILITAFTIGHSISLLGSTLNLLQFNPDLIELLIPITILITAILNIYAHHYLGKIHYLITVMFGLIHGLGFSGYLKMLLGKEENLFTPLLSFNLGLEFGQLLFTSLIIVIVTISNTLFATNRRTTNLVLSGISILVSLLLIYERI